WEDNAVTSKRSGRMRHTHAGPEAPRRPACSLLRENRRSVRPREIFASIEIWYNRQRLHSALGYTTPAGYENLVQAV
ncbi:MAG TPA: hypothetical protein VHR86_01550, partial [Armatimonadota bacterium]|nr:hypothetical protein [Armatimonadota bacterium]